ncbi:MAG: aminoacyl-histidine dipeptidase [Bacteroides sp. SM23_62]|nr:MAG: aminoacyl-histidine dipeptidase [Bacteroides sp. SM23_62]
MSTEIKNLEPRALWEIFYELTQVPRPSKMEHRAVIFAKEFGEKLELKTHVDKTGNVIISKPATTGYENRQGVILQAHLDMVPQKNSDTQHDFENDPIDAHVDGDWVKARGTTLGADNGIGIAAALAVLQDKNLKHGPIEVLLTVDEETGMTGAFQLEGGLLEGKILVNLDSEDEGELYIGCAGGMDTSGKLTYLDEPVRADTAALKLGITGLKGGHSGLDIHLGRGNANVLLCRFMFDVADRFDMRLTGMEGGSLRNAIPREAFAIVTVPAEQKDDFLAAVKEHEEIYRAELGSVEPDLSFEASGTDSPLTIMDKASQDKLVRLVYGLPNGVIRMDPNMPGVTETSTNLAIVKTGNGDIDVQCLLRSSVDSAKLSLGGSIQSVFELAGAEVTHSGSYPGWKPDVDSPILSTMKAVYERDFGKVPEVKVIHAGLECGIIADAYPGLDTISIGPTIRFPHSPDEKVHIESVQKFWDFLVRTLEEIPEK